MDMTCEIKRKPAIKLHPFSLSSYRLKFPIRLLFAQYMQERSAWAAIFQAVDVVQQQESFGLVFRSLMMMVVMMMVVMVRVVVRPCFWVRMRREFVPDALRANSIGTLHALNGGAVFAANLGGGIRRSKK